MSTIITEGKYKLVISPYKDISLYKSDNMMHYGIFNKTGHILSMFSYDSTGQKPYGKCLVFYKGNRLKYYMNVEDYKLHGETWFFNKKGKLNAIYLYESDTLKRVLYARNEKFKNVESTDKVFTFYKPLIRE